MPTFADPPKNLTPRQQRFVDAYAGCSNATQAARAAGYRDAKNEGYRLINRSHIQAAIQKRLREALLTQRDTMTAEEFVIRLTKRARSSIDSFLEEDEQGRVRLTLDTEEAREDIDAVRHFKRVTIESGAGIEVIEEIEVHDALPALRLLAQLHGFDKEKSDRTATAASAAVPTTPPAPSEPPKMDYRTREEARERLAEILNIPVDMLPPISE